MAVEFKTSRSEDIKFGSNNFIEVAKKTAVTDQGNNEFISVSRGFYAPDNTKRYKKSIAVPIDMKVLEKLAEVIKTIAL